VGGDEGRVVRKIVRQQHGISATRLLAALLTAGLSLPFLGVRRVTRETTVWK
jgi:hypothetical protein